MEITNSSHYTSHTSIILATRALLKVLLAIQPCKNVRFAVIYIIKQCRIHDKIGMINAVNYEILAALRLLEDSLMVRLPRNLWWSIS